MLAPASLHSPAAASAHALVHDSGQVSYDLTVRWPLTADLDVAEIEAVRSARHLGRVSHGRITHVPMDDRSLRLGLHVAITSAAPLAMSGVMSVDLRGGACGRPSSFLMTYPGEIHDRTVLLGLPKSSEPVLRGALPENMAAADKLVVWRIWGLMAQSAVVNMLPVSLYADTELAPASLTALPELVCEPRVNDAYEVPSPHRGPIGPPGGVCLTLVQVKVAHPITAELDTAILGIVPLVALGHVGSVSLAHEPRADGSLRLVAKTTLCSTMRRSAGLGAHMHTCISNTVMW